MRRAFVCLASAAAVCLSAGAGHAAAQAIPPSVGPAADPATAPSSPTPGAPGAAVPLATHATIDLTRTEGRVSAGLPRAHATDLRGTWAFDDGDVLTAEFLDEAKFGHRGGITGVGYTKPLGADWIVYGAVALGHGHSDWASKRADAEVTTKWGADRAVLTRVGVYRALYANARSDRGLRLSLVGYLPASIVVEGGTTLNISEPGRVRSHMAFASITHGQEGVQYLALRAQGGTEAYQSIGDQRQLVGFRSHAVGVTWRRWLAPRWGVTAQAEHYRNISYERFTAGLGLFVQW